MRQPLELHTNIMGKHDGGLRAAQRGLNEQQMLKEKFLFDDLILFYSTLVYTTIL